MLLMLTKKWLYKLLLVTMVSGCVEYQFKCNTECPKKVHKFEIKNLYSEIRSISKVGVICQTSPQLRF